MGHTFTRLGMAALAVWLCAGTTGAAQSALTAEDRAEIQALSAAYARTLGTCAAADYAALFAEDGYFASGFRGKVQGREALMELVRSERHCQTDGPRTARAVPTVSVEPSPDGALGKVDLGQAGAYEDAYVKTAQGWRFKSRTHFTLKEVQSRRGQ